MPMPCNCICSAATTRPPRVYEFPTGFNTVFGPERFLSGELYFTHQHLQVWFSSSFRLDTPFMNHF